jgi:hypothetical protein
MGRLDHYREQLARLADPRTLPESQAQAVLDDAKPVYYLNAGLHSPEMGSPEVVMEVAYRLAASDDPAIRRIRDNVIVVINTVAEPDGRDKQVDWYYRYTKKLTDWDDGFPRTVPYWGRYIVHDNNRDGLQISAALTKAIFASYYKWHPTVMLDLHESVPLIYMSTGTGPYNETIDPITISEWQVLANHDVTSITAQGLPGAFTWAFYDGWWPGYGIWVANNHNAIGRFYETFGNAGANTYVRDLSDSRYANDPVTSRTWYRPDPATKKVRWSARDNVNYMEAGVLSALGYAADNGPSMLRNFYQKGLNNIDRGRTLKPHAFVIPKDQRDPRRAAYLVNQLQRQKIEVHRRTAGDSAGDYVVLLNQPYRNLAVTLLTKQNFPSDALYPPYDDIAWTLQWLYGVDLKAVDDSAALHWPNLALMTDTASYVGAVAGSGPVWLLDYKAQAELLPALYWLKEQSPKAKAYAAEKGFTVATSAAAAGSGPSAAATMANDSFATGAVIFEGVSASTASTLAQRFGLDLRAAASAPSVARHELDAPRVAIYHTWYSTQDEGWARYTFEQSAVPYTSIDKDDLRKGDLRRRFDVILVPSVGGDFEQLVHGIDRKWGPMPYTKTSEFQAHGTPDSTDDMTGGPGFEGIANLQRFVEDGGMLIASEGATALAAESGIARPMSSKSTGNLFHPGSIVRAKARRPDHPILYGYPETFQIFRGNGPLYQVARRDRSMMVLQFGTKKLPDEEEKFEGPMLGIPDFGAKPDSAKADTTAAKPAAPAADNAYVMSGMVRNESQIVGQAAILDVPVGTGRVVAFMFNPLHRFLNHHEFPLVWNALANWNDFK